MYLEYQRKYQNKWYSKIENKKKRDEYNQRPNVKLKIRKYYAIYRKKNYERIRELQKKWDLINWRRNVKTKK
jgi:hypothetical protein